MKRRKFKLKVETLDMKPEDRLDFMNKSKHLKFIKSQVKKTKNKKVIDVFRKEISGLRDHLRYDFAHKFYKVTVMLGPHKEEEIFSFYPTPDRIVDLKNTLVDRLSGDRKQRKELHKETREFNGMRYTMIAGSRNSNDWGQAVPRDGTWAVAFEPGGATVRQATNKKENNNSKILPNLKGGGRVFSESESIIKLLNSPEYAQRINRAKKPYDKNNYVGVELELITSVSKERLNQLFIDARLSGMVYVKHDGSIEREKDSEIPHEVTILGKEQNINDIISRVCKVLNSDEVKAYVNNSCGLHVHIDMRRRNAELCYKNFFKALPVLAKMVPANRTSGSHAQRYCAMNRNPELDINESRYQALNPAAVRSHQTLELRLHSGSTNAKKINNFINILTAIANRTTEVLPEQNSANGYIVEPKCFKREFGISDDLVKYMEERIEKFTNNKIDTRVDHFEAAV